MVVFEMSVTNTLERSPDMTTSTRITASLIDAFKKHPEGLTLDVNTGKTIHHGIAVGGFHANYLEPWRRWDNDGAGFSIPFEVLQEAIEADITNIMNAGFIGVWVQNNVLTLDIVKVFDCIACFDDATAEPFHVAKDNEQIAVGWLCPDWSNGYKEILI